MHSHSQLCNHTNGKVCVPDTIMLTTLGIPIGNYEKNADLPQPTTEKAEINREDFTSHLDWLADRQRICRANLVQNGYLKSRRDS